MTDVVPVEDLVRRIVLPMAAHLPVLLAVVDGMSVGVATEITEGLATDGWVEHLPAGAARRGAALAALPSVTSVSRTSLFTGALRKGDQTAEKAGLGALAAAAGLTAVVLHKADLDRSTAGQLLPVPVLEALAGPDRIVGVVFNTVDDALDRATGVIANRDHVAVVADRDEIITQRVVFFSALQNAFQRTLDLRAQLGHLKADFAQFRAGKIFDLAGG